MPKVNLSTANNNFATLTPPLVNEIEIEQLKLKSIQSELIETRITVAHQGLNLIKILDKFNNAASFANETRKPKDQHRYLNKDESYLKIIENLKLTPGDVGALRNYLLNYSPHTFEEFLFFIEHCIVLFMAKNLQPLEKDLFLVSKSFQMKQPDWDQNPIHLHVLSKRIFDLLENDKNRIYFVRKISNLSRLGLNVSCCIGWAVFNKILGKDLTMFRFYKFCDLVRELKNIDLKNWKETKIIELYGLLEVISFLQNLIISYERTTFKSTIYERYFHCTVYEIKELRNWLARLNKLFEMKPNENCNFNENYSFIKDILDLDLLYFLGIHLSSDDNQEEEMF